MQAQSDYDERQLHELSTCIPDFLACHLSNDATAARNAQEKLLLRYQKPITSYVRKALPDAQDADEIFQEFATNFIKGRYRSFDPGRGRFRQYLKTALFHLVSDHHRRLNRGGIAVANVPENFKEPTEVSEDEQFRLLWREEVIRKGFEELDKRESAHPQSVIASALRLKAQVPSPSSREIAEILSAKKGFDVKEKKVRKAVHEGRHALLTFLVREVELTLDRPTREELEDELIELGLHSLCKKVLNEQRGDCRAPDPLRHP